MKNPIYEPPKFNTNKALLFGHVPFAISLNDSATLSGSKEEIKKKIKDQIITLANNYVSLATFVTSEELEIINTVKESLDRPETMNKELYNTAIVIYEKVLKDIENLKDEVSRVNFI